MSFQKIYSSCKLSLLISLIYFTTIINAFIGPSTKPSNAPSWVPTKPTAKPTTFEPTYPKFVRPPTPLSNNAVAARGVILIIVVVIPASIALYCLYYFVFGPGRKSVNKVLISMGGKNKSESGGYNKDVETGPSKRSRRDNQAAMEVDK